MNVKKFTAATSREALRKVRDALGPDAVILSNRPVDGVVEILALDNDDVASLASPSPESEMAAPRPNLRMQEPAFDDFEPAPAPAPAPAPTPRPAARPAPRVFQEAPAARQSLNPLYEMDEPAAPAVPPTYANRRAPQPEAPAFDMAAMTAMMSAAIAQAKESAAAEMHGMMNEIRAMRGMMESQLAELSWGTTQQREPQKAAVLREMLAAGFSASLSRYLIDKLPAGKDAA